MSPTEIFVDRAQNSAARVVPAADRCTDAKLFLRLRSQIFGTFTYAHPVSPRATKFGTATHHRLRGSAALL